MSSLSIYRPEQAPTPAREGGRPIVTVEHVVRQYLAYLDLRAQAGKCSPDHLANTRRALKRFVAWESPRGPCGAQPAAECRPGDLDLFLLSNPKIRSDHSKRGILSAVIACFSWAAHRAEIVPHCRYRMPKDLKPKPAREATAHEAAMLVRHGGRCLQGALRFLCRTGARPGEMFRAEFAQIQGKMLVQTDHKTVHQTGVARRISLDGPVRKLIGKVQGQARPGQALIFPNSRGNPWNRRSFGLAIRRLAKRIGLDEAAKQRGVPSVTAYSCRHYFAGRLAAKGWAAERIALLLGHTNSTMVQRVYVDRRHYHAIQEQMADGLRGHAPQRFLPGMKP